jgi:hypothetical protein
MTAAELRLRAAEVVQAAISLDVPRLVVLEECVADRRGSSVGSGHRLATAHGHPGAVAVRVAAESLHADWLTRLAGEECGVEVAARLALADVVRVTAHEVAHALDAPTDAAADADTARAWVEAASLQDNATEIAASHRARWAVVFSIIAGRCRRRVWRGVVDYLARGTAESIASYGHDHRQLRRAAGRVPRGVPLRDYFASRSPACRRLSAVTTTDAERAVVIGRWLTPPAAVPEPERLNEQRQQRGAADVAGIP